MQSTNLLLCNIVRLNLAALVLRPAINFSMFCLGIKNVVILNTIKNVKFVDL